VRPTVRVFIASLALLAAACGSGQERSAQDLCPNPVPATEVQMVDFAYAPTCVEARPGTTLSVRNDGQAPHTFTVVGTDVDANVAAGQSERVDLSGIAPGTYEVICTYHPQMVAALRVA
jgi:plastocyanin